MTAHSHPIRFPVSLAIILAIAGLLSLGSSPTGSLLPGLAAPAGAAEAIQIADPPTETGLHLVSQGPDGVSLHFGQDQFALEAVAVGNETLRAVSMPGVFLPNDAGSPDLPGLSRYIALPQGASARLTVVSSRQQTINGIEIAPAPVIPREGDDAPLIYERNPSIYGRNADYPEQPVHLSEPMKIRGVDVVLVGITPFQYNPVTKKLVIHSEFEIRIDFVGGNGRFGEDRLRNRYWDEILRGNLLNFTSLPALDLIEPPAGNRDGYEYVIITPPDPEYVFWANELRDWRTLQGITTAVFTTDEIGTSTAQIDAWLANAYNSWATPPAAFLLLGDYPNSDGGATGIYSPVWDGYCVSDNMYADVDGDDLPDMAPARICARTAAELETMVTKMFEYEQNPITDPSFYAHPVIAGGWQTERWFILCNEVIWGHQAQVLGKSPVREYAIYSGTPGTVWSTATNTSTVVNYFGPNGLGYIPATPQHLDDWGGNATRLNADLNAGAYMLMHRDHGYEYGWGEPDYDNGDLGGLTTTQYPFVFSINCLTGRYDYGSETFAERFHRLAHGALGVIAASDVSYSFVNDTFVWGMFDGMWPDFMPTYGPYEHGPDPLRTCFGMAHGKYFLRASSWPYNTSNKVVTYHLFHHHGDAFMRIYSEVPQTLAVVHDAELSIGAEHFTVQAEAGAFVALTVDGEIIGRAQATGSPQEIPITPQMQAATLRVTVTAPNFFRYDVSIPITAGGPTITAAFSAAPTAGCAPLDVIFTDESSGTVESWDWDFGDGTSSTLQYPVHQYAAAGSYSVSLTVTGPAGSDTETKNGYVTVSGPAVADFSGAPTAGTAPLTVSFTDLSTDATSWSWTFGDGGSSEAQHPVHTYGVPGDYTVSLTAGNDCGYDIETKSAYIHVEEAPPVILSHALADIPVAGTVSGTYTNTQGSDDILQVITEVSSQSHPRKWFSMLEHQWEFNVAPGTSVTLHVEAHRPANSDGDDFTFGYSTDGFSFTDVITVASAAEETYSAALPATLSGTVYLRVVDSDRTRENQSLDSIHIDYLAIETLTGAAPPAAAFEGDPVSGFAPLLVQFTDQSAGQPVSWEWTFGDGGASSEQHPSHLYDAPGCYSVSLTVTNAEGSDTLLRSEYINVLAAGSLYSHVHDMTVSRRQVGNGYKGLCTAWVHDQAGQPLANATVTVSVTGPSTESLSSLTGSDGSVAFTTLRVRNPIGEWCFEVMGIDHATHTYEPAANNVTIACESGVVEARPGQEGEDEAAELSRMAFGGGEIRSSWSPRTHTIFFSLPEATDVRLDVFTVTGERIATLASGAYPAGVYGAPLDTRDLGSGIYFYRFQAGAVHESHKVMIIR